MQTKKYAKIAEKLEKLSEDKLEVVYDFISYLVERESNQQQLEQSSESFQTMLASEETLRKDWDRAEEDEAWANL